jgi:hypothetical protein
MADRMPSLGRDLGVGRGSDTLLYCRSSSPSSVRLGRDERAVEVEGRRRRVRGGPECLGGVEHGQRGCRMGNL